MVWAGYCCRLNTISTDSQLGHLYIPTRMYWDMCAGCMSVRT
jgi:hypothetical protein